MKYPMQSIQLTREPLLTSKLEAYAYQAEAVRAVRDLEYAAIYHEQGLGKTKIAIDLMIYWLQNKLLDTVLLVVKKGLISNWEDELAYHTFLSPRILSNNRNSNYFVFNSPARLILTHYEAVRSEHDRMSLFLKTRNVGAILDESTKIKNPESMLTKTFLDLAPGFVRRVIMTGTPVANRPYDIWSQIAFLDNGASLGQDFGSFKQSVDLSNELSKDQDKQNAFQTDLETIYKSIEAFSVRETKESGVIQLPKKEIRQIVTDWEPHQENLYREIRDSLRATVIMDGVPVYDDSESILKRLLRLVQVASNPRLIDKGYSAEPGKLASLRDIVYSNHRKGEKSIIWTSFTDNVDWLFNELREYHPCKVHGKMHINARTNSIRRFKSLPEYELLIATPGVAKEGLTLTVANHIIFYDRGFSLDDYLQAQDRIHRISQQKTCFVHNLVMQSSIDEWVDILLHSKHVAAQFAQGDISTGEYEDLMSYEFGEILKEILANQ